jgi:hypothetical protein
MDVGVVVGIVGTLGTLGGVALGGRLADRSQRRLFLEAQATERHKIRRSACIDYLAAHRRFRRFLLTEAITVDLVAVEDRPEQPTALAYGVGLQWDAYERAAATIDILVDDNDLYAAMSQMRRTLWTIMRARATYAAGAVPVSIVDPARAAEDGFMALAQHRVGHS